LVINVANISMLFVRCICTASCNIALIIFIYFYYYLNYQHLIFLKDDIRDLFYPCRLKKKAIFGNFFREKLRKYVLHCFHMLFVTFLFNLKFCEVTMLIVSLHKISEKKSVWFEHGAKTEVLQVAPVIWKNLRNDFSIQKKYLY